METKNGQTHDEAKTGAFEILANAPEKEFIVKLSSFIHSFFRSFVNGSTALCWALASSSVS
jgi:hypothetical protein